MLKKYICKVLLILTFAVFLVETANAIDFTMITAGGYVSFQAGDDWMVIAMETKNPIQFAAFQILMPSEKENDASTNVSVSLINTALPEAKRGLDIIGKCYGKDKPIESEYKGWTTFRQEAHDGDSEFTVVDAKKNVSTVVVYVRFTWPKSRNAQVEPMLASFLDSVSGGVGQYIPKDSEIVRHPIE